MKNNISSTTSLKWYTEFVRKNAGGVRSVNLDVNGIFAGSLNMALSMFILEKHFFVVVSVIIVLDINKCTANSHSCDVNAIRQNTVGSHTCYWGNGTHVSVRTVLKKYRKKTRDYGF